MRTVRVPYFTLNRRVVVASIPLRAEITPKVEHIFGNGQCRGLALALHEILGWPIMGAYNSFSDDWRTKHYVLLTPTRLTADINGIRCVDYSLRKTSPRAVRQPKPGWLPISMELAEFYAPAIAAALRLQNDAIEKGLPKPRWTLCSEGYLPHPDSAAPVANLATREA